MKFNSTTNLNFSVECSSESHKILLCPKCALSGVIILRITLHDPRISKMTRIILLAALSYIKSFPDLDILMLSKFFSAYAILT